MKKLSIVLISLLLITGMLFAGGTREQSASGNASPAVQEQQKDLATISADNARLVVYGNANNDDLINTHDVDIIGDIASGKASWDKTANPFADANADGKVDSSDVDLVEKIVNKEKCTVYYRDFQDEAVAVNYPITGTVGTMYYQQAQLSILLGLWDKDVIACGVRNLNDTIAPGFEQKISFGQGYNVDPELVVESGVDTLICYTQTDTTAPDIKKLVRATGLDLNVLCINHESLLECVVTYGFLFDRENISLKYAEYADNSASIIDESLKNVSREEQPSVATVMLYGKATTDKIRVLGYNPMGNTNNLPKLVHSIPNNNWIRADLENPAYGTYVTSEWFIENDPDYILLAVSGIGTTPEMTESEVYDVLYTKCREVFEETSAFKNGQIIAATHASLNGYSGPLQSLKLLSFVYDEIDKAYADEVYNAWYDDYAMYSIDDYSLERIFYVNPQ